MLWTDNNSEPLIPQNAGLQVAGCLKQLAIIPQQYIHFFNFKRFTELKPNDYIKNIEIKPTLKIAPHFLPVG
jgi:hypothetical protein